jgi:hypothetical protein
MQTRFKNSAGIPMGTGLSTFGRQSQIYKILSIGKSTYYDKLKYLKIDPTKDAEGTYLNAEQIKLMNL